MLTEWGLGFSSEKVEALKEAARLKTCVCVLRMRDADIMLTIVGVKPTVEECADAFVLMAKSSSITGSSLKIGESFSEKCGSRRRGCELIVWSARCWIVRMKWRGCGDKPVGFIFLDMSDYIRLPSDPNIE